MSYLWQQSHWPDFVYNISNIPIESLYQYSQSVGRLSLNLEKTPEDLRVDAVLDLMVKEAVTTSAIEGEALNPDDVRSSLKNHLGLTYPTIHIRDPRAQGISALMVTNYRDHESDLTEEVLFRWHRMVLPKAHDTWGRVLKVGEWRTEGIEVVSGPPNKQRVHFEGPPAELMSEEMARFFDWYNRTNPINLAEGETSIIGPVRAAIAHLWFVTIHPFDDGNGRVARALCDHALSQDARYPMLHSLSTAIDAKRNEYYEQLERVQSQDMVIDEWVKWFVEVTCESVKITERVVDFTLKKASFIKQHQAVLNARQLQVVLALFDNGADGDPKSINRNKYVNQTRCAPRTALRDLSDLVEKGVLVKLTGLGRNTRYGLHGL
jgi:Fic family protein